MLFKNVVNYLIVEVIYRFFEQRIELKHLYEE